MDLKVGDQQLQYGDVRFYYQIHKNKMKAQNKIPVSYSTFQRRLKKYRMNLHDAIYTEGTPIQKAKSKTPIQDNIRRVQLLHSENVPVIDLSTIEGKRRYGNHARVLNHAMKPPKKKSLIDRFISFFKG